MKIRAMLAVVVALGAASGAPATAQDQRPCVSKREYYSVNGLVPQVRSNVEERWDVVGRGIRIRHFERRATYTVRYVACGYSPNEGGVIIQYWKQGDAEKRSKRNIGPDATMHGHV